MEPVGEASEGLFRVHYFVIAILFIIFDVETLFLFPWAVILTDKTISVLVFVEMFIFIVVLAVGLVYAWAKGALEWV
jgi:NADH-quinone oxidoreductase subunit A